MARLEVESEVTGNVWKVEVEAGERVEEGDVLLILESMKMEIPLEAPTAGTVAEVLVAVEDAVQEDQVVGVLDTSGHRLAATAKRSRPMDVTKRNPSVSIRRRREIEALRP